MVPRKERETESHDAGDCPDTTKPMDPTRVRAKEVAGDTKRPHLWPRKGAPRPSEPTSSQLDAKDRRADSLRRTNRSCREQHAKEGGRRDALEASKFPTIMKPPRPMTRKIVGIALEKDPENFYGLYSTLPHPPGLLNFEGQAANFKHFAIFHTTGASKSVGEQ